MLAVNSIGFFCRQSGHRPPCSTIQMVPPARVNWLELVRFDKGNPRDLSLWGRKSYSQAGHSIFRQEPAWTTHHKGSHSVGTRLRTDRLPSPAIQSILGQEGQHYRGGTRRKLRPFHISCRHHETIRYSSGDGLSESDNSRGSSELAVEEYCQNYRPHGRVEGISAPSLDHLRGPG